jgi:hypothetical protein
MLAGSEDEPPERHLTRVALRSVVLRLAARWAALTRDGETDLIHCMAVGVKRLMAAERRWWSGWLSRPELAEPAGLTEPARACA